LTNTYSSMRVLPKQLSQRPASMVPRFTCETVVCSTKCHRPANRRRQGPHRETRKVPPGRPLPTLRASLRRFSVSHPGGECRVSNLMVNYVRIWLMIARYENEGPSAHVLLPRIWVGQGVPRPRLPARGRIPYRQRTTKTPRRVIVTISSVI